jgi:ABC-2 type transport system permease protein
MLMNNVPFRKQSVFLSLYYKTFLRSNDFFGIYVRLLLIGALILYFLPAGISGLIALLLFLHISGMQLYTLWRHPSSAEWEDIYPISDTVRKQSFVKVTFSLLTIKSILFSIVLFLNGWMVAQSVLGILLGVGFSALFSRIYLDKKIAKTG